MVKKKSKRLKSQHRKSSSPMLIGEKIFALLESMGGNRQRADMAALWENWQSVVGDELAELARPLGYKEHTLILGAEDGMTIQEARMREVEFLECANAFLRSEYFNRLKVDLLGKRK